MHFSSALITLALAACSSVSAVNSVVTATTTSSQGTNLPANIATSSNVPHASYVLISTTAGTNIGYTFSYTVNGTVGTPVTVPAAAASTTAATAVGPMSCSVCSPSIILNDGTSYNWQVSAFGAAATSTSGTVTGVLTSVTEPALLTSTVPKNLAAADGANAQQGKLYAFEVPAGTTSANATNATIAISGSVTPFKNVYIVGNSHCPMVPATSDNITRVNYSIAATAGGAGMASTQVIQNLTKGIFWMYLEPSTTANSLSSSTATDAITVTVSPYTNQTCVAGANGFCSGAATIKSVVGVAFAGAMAAAFMLF